jgi:fructokinase
VLAALAKLGKSVAFLGMVGDDQFGMYLKRVIEENRISARGLKISQKANTTLAFVHLNEYGDRNFSFYRKPGADMMFSCEDIDYDIINDSKIFHFGSVSMTDEPVASATFRAAEYAKQHGLIISYDPNLRPPLWNSLDDARKKIMKGLEYADILKISENELEFITGTKDLEKGSEILYDMGIKIVLITLGPEGCYYKYKQGQGKLSTYDTKVVDTTGSGDAFLGGVLYCLSAETIEEFDDISRAEFENIVDFANAMGALAATKKGAIPSMPGIDEIEACRKTIPRLIL